MFDGSAAAALDCADEYSKMGIALSELRENFGLRKEAERKEEGLARLSARHESVEYNKSKLLQRKIADSVLFRYRLHKHEFLKNVKINNMPI